MADRIKLIVGLGNPGAEYVNTRHNAGFWFINVLAEKYKATLSHNSKFFADIAKVNVDGKEVILGMPDTYMNLSGKAVLAIASFYKVLPQEILVVHDELDFAPGSVKFKLGGGSGGHNGIKDIERVIGANYWRLRLGIGHPGDRNKVHDYVLKKPSTDDEISIYNAIDRAIKVIPAMVAGDAEVALKNLHTN